MISIQHLTYAYQGSRHKVFDDFSLSLQSGGIYGLLGQNGTGKSTLLYLICGLLRPKKGTVTVDGMVSLKRTPHLLADLFLVPEEFDLPECSLKEYVRVNSVFYPHFSHDMLKSCLDDFGIEPEPNLKRLSMGQKKKVYMSYALATGTRLLLMDEPTNGLDIPSKSLFRKIVAKNMTDDRTLIISTHQVHDIERLLDHIVIIDRSQVLLDAATADITERYTFGTIPTSEAASALYTEPSVGGLNAISLRQDGEPETQLNLELLFDAAINGKLQNS